MRIRRSGTGLGLLVVIGAVAAACGDDDNGTAPGPRGDFTINTVTTGVEPDFEYGIQIDGIWTRAVGANDSAQFANIAVSTYSIELVDVSDNCIVEPDNPRPLTLVADSNVETTFDVECFETTGILEVVTATTGQMQDDSYSLAVDGSDVGTIGANDTARTADLVTGDHTLELGSIAVNCVLGGDPSRTVRVPSQGTVTSRYEIFCTDQVGDLRIVLESGGLGDPDGVDVVVQLADPVNVGGNDTLFVASVAEGVARVTVLEESISQICSLVGPNPRSVDIRTGEVTETTFRFDCRG